MAGLTKDSFVRGYQFDGATGLHSGEQLEDLVTRATPSNGSEAVDQDTIETYLDEILNLYRFRVKDGSITAAKLADGSITNAKLAEGFSMVKSVQRSSVWLAASATVSVTLSTAVDPNKAVLLVFGNVDNNSNTIAPATLTNSTTITFHNNNSSFGYLLSWQVIEFI